MTKLLRSAGMLLTALALLAGVAQAQDQQTEPGETPILVFISWDGTPGWVIEQLIAEEKVPNLEELMSEGVYVARTVGNWPSVTAAGHAAVFTGAYGNVNGITGNGVPLAPFDEHEIGAGTTSGFSAANLLAEPFWVTAARQGRQVAGISFTQSAPFDMYTSADFVSDQGAPSFGDYSENLLIVDPYAAIAERAGVIRASEAGITLSETDTADWANLPGDGPYRAFTLGGGEAPLYGLLWASDGETFDTMILSESRDYEGATVLKAVPFSLESAEAVSEPISLTLGDASGYTRLRLASIAPGGTDFELWHSSISELNGHITDESVIEELRAAAGSVSGNGAYLPPFAEAPPLPNAYAELAFIVNEWFFGGLEWAIKRNQADVYFSYTPYPDEWFHSYYRYLLEDFPGTTAAIHDKAWDYTYAIFANLDQHLGDIVTALEATGRPWNVIMTTDHGFDPYIQDFYPNRVLLEANILNVDAEGKPIPAETVAFYGFENQGGIHINTVPEAPDNGQEAGIVESGEVEAVIERVTSALLAARDPQTGVQIVEAVYRAEENSDYGLGGPHGADLYLDLAPGYYWDSSTEAGPLVSEAPPYSAGMHGMKPVDNDSMQGYAVLAGANFADGLIVTRAKSIAIAPTAARAVGLEPPAAATGDVQEAWIK